MSQIGYTFDDKTTKRIAAAVRRVEGLRPGVGSNTGPGQQGIGSRICKAQTIGDHPTSVTQPVQMFFIDVDGSVQQSGSDSDTSYQPKALNDTGSTIKDGTNIFIVDFSGAGNWEIFQPPQKQLQSAFCTQTIVPLFGGTAATAFSGACVFTNDANWYIPVGTPFYVQINDDGSCTIVGAPTRPAFAKLTGNLPIGGSATGKLQLWGPSGFVDDGSPNTTAIQINDPGMNGGTSGQVVPVGWAGAWLLQAVGCAA